MAMYLFLNIVLLLNLLIAILSSTYGKLEDQGIGLYLRTIIELLPQWRTQTSKNALTFRVPLLNLLNLCCFSCLLRGSKRLNYFLEILNFIPAFIILLTLFLLLDILSLPFAWFSTIVKTIRSKSCSLFILTLLLFPPLSLGLLVLDIILLTINLWKKPSSSLSSKSNDPILSSEELDLV